MRVVNRLSDLLFVLARNADGAEDALEGLSGGSSIAAVREPRYQVRLVKHDTSEEALYGR